ncbi:(Fe-S)-binding protein [Nonomuraea sp. NPDC050691]|uniref:(Fe-S)-binding protein n=1 Tax=Nonomuraea sp. NPDC050691 TaxID=3155661 RepID=UPI00340E6224
MTGFTPDLLNRCIACGFCLPACPTYALTKDETSSPRGRIDLMRALDEGRLPADDPRVREEASFCLGCRACETVCPAGVQYGDLLEEWRDQQWQGTGRPLAARLLMILVDARWRVRLLGLLRRHARNRGTPEGPSLMLGCFERALFPRVSRAARRLFPELAAPAAQGCCGALHAHNGDSARGRRMAEELGGRLPGTIVTTSGGCAAHLSAVLGRDRVKELSQYAHERAAADTADQDAGGEGRPRIALQDSCHLRNGLDVWREPRAMLERIGTYVELPSAGTCCGAAGTYALVRPSDSRRVLDAKLDEIEAAGVDYVAVVNPGCYRQLDQGLRRRKSRVRAVHLAELLAGERPRRRRDR